MRMELVGDKLVLQRTAEELTPFKQRLNRIEGQIRGLKQMIENNRYCGDALQQSNAVIAAIREVALMLISQQLQGQLETAKAQALEQDGASHPGMSDLVDLLRSTYRLQ